jgi:tetratricopeptide (TPR) repeat protein
MGKAKRELLAAVKLAPGLPEAYKFLGVLSLRERDFAQAEQYFKESLRRAVRADALTLLGVAKVRLDKVRPARGAFQRAIAIDSTFKEAYYNLAFYKNTERLKKAEVLYEKAVRLDPDDSVAHARLGLYLKQIGKLEKAKSSLERALGLDPSYKEA